MITRLHLHAIPKPHDSVHIKVQAFRPDGTTHTVGTLHVRAGMFHELREALATKFTVTTTGQLEYMKRVA